MPRPYPPRRNVQWQTVRDKVDEKFLDLARRLDDSYYGTALGLDSEGSATSRAADGWKHGVSHPFISGPNTYDVQPTPGESQILFDKLHGVIWQHHTIASVDQNITDGLPYPDMDIQREEQELPRKPEDLPDEVRFRIVEVSRKAKAQGMVDALVADGIEIAIV